MDIFVSSVIRGMEEYRTAVEASVTSLGHNPIKAEDFAATPNSPQKACLSAVRESDAVILVLGESYGTIQESGYSATHEEFLEAKGRKPIFAFILDKINPDHRQTALLSEVQDWLSGSYTATFRDSETLRLTTTKAIHRWEISLAAGKIDEEEIIARVEKILPEDSGDRYSSSPQIAVGFVGSPVQSVLRPSKLEDESFRREITQTAIFGDPSIFSSEEGTEAKINNHTLILRQDNQSLCLDELGSILIVKKLQKNDNIIGAIIEENVKSTIANTIHFASKILDKIDPLDRLSHIGIAAKIINADHCGWRTDSENRLNPNSISLSFLSDGKSAPVYLTPVHKQRPFIRQNYLELGDDLTILLRRKFNN